VRMRQRLRFRGSPLALIGRALIVLLAAALVWYGLMFLLLALKVDPDTVNDLSGYRSAYDYLADLEPDDVDGQFRLIAGLAGLAAFLLFGYLALKEVPRPYLARSDMQLEEQERGVTEIEPRAIERVAEAAALELPSVASATGRYGTDDLGLDITLARARGLAEPMCAVWARVLERLAEHGLPALPVNVTLTSFERKGRRELR
jgi:hypothetical protein